MSAIATWKKLSLASTGVTVSALVISPASHAAVMFFTDINDFNAVTETTLVEDFEDLTQTDRPLGSFVSNNNTYAALAGAYYGRYSPNIHIASPGYSSFGVPMTESTILTASGDEHFAVDFGIPSTALGFDTYLNAFGPATIQVFGSGGLLDTSTLQHDPTEVGFLGVLADQEITSIRWTTVLGRHTDTGIDNIVQGKAIVPEPSSAISLLTLGTVGIRSGIKRRKL